MMAKIFVVGNVSAKDTF